jgi:hypothetical protein
MRTIEHHAASFKVASRATTNSLHVVVHSAPLSTKAAKTCKSVPAA